MRPLVLATLAAALMAALAIAPVDVARAGGGIKADEATYVAMAASVAYDGDLVYTASDYERIRSWFGSGPEGIFLKRDAQARLHFGKAYLYGILAAPFAVAGLKGLVFFNLLCLIVTVAAGIWWLTPGSRRSLATAYSLLFAMAAITPLYTVWLTSDMLNYALVFLAFALAWRRESRETPGAVRVWIGVVLLAAAIFSKPLNALLMVPLVLGAVAGLRRQAAMLVAAGVIVLALFAVNFVMMGDMNYQGGDRKTFYTRFPYDELGGSYDTTGIQMATNTVQTPVGGEGRLTTVPVNAWYFVAGRHFGLVPFGWPWALSVMLWIVARPPGGPWRTWRPTSDGDPSPPPARAAKPLAEWVLLAAVLATALATIVWMPYTWSGGGGPIGNRYFLSIAAALFFLTPPVRSVVPVVLAAFGLVFVLPSFAAPFEVAKQPWLATRAAPFRLLPLELTGASDFPIILDQHRGRMPQGRRPALFVSFLDGAADFGDHGWIAVAPDARAELLVRSAEPLASVTIGVKSPDSCRIAVADGSAAIVPLGAGERRDISHTPVQTFSRDSFVFVLTVATPGCRAPVQVALQGVRRP
jgi:hypothetical protein